MKALGIDTSNYSTSLAISDESGRIYFETTTLLKVPAGGRGLRQSEAMYQHVQNLPEMIEAIPQTLIKAGDIAVIFCSDRPRPLEDSYMPVFKAGISLAKTLGVFMGVPVHFVSHQENHLRAAIYGCGKTPADFEKPFLGVHFSGGTSEIMAVKPKAIGYDAVILGESLDLKAGQLIDRVGVAMGYDFPAGKALDALACRATKKSSQIAAAVDGLNFHFSGQENKAMTELKAGIPAEEVAYGVFRSIGKTLIKVLSKIAEEKQMTRVLFSGGVMGNSIIRELLTQKLRGLELCFSEPKYASDNAVGNALLGSDMLKGENSDQSYTICYRS